MIETTEWGQFLKTIQINKNILYLPVVNGSQDITKLAVSLANGEGGTVVIGFDRNNLQIRGVNFDGKWLNAVLYNECKPMITYILKDCIKNNKRIFIVDVQEGTQKPYSTYGTSYVKENDKILEVSEENKQTVKIDTSDNQQPRSTVENRLEKCLEYINTHGEITNSKYRELNGVSHKTAHNELSELIDQKKIIHVGQGRATKYVLYTNELQHRTNELNIKAFNEPIAEKLVAEESQDNLFGATALTDIAKSNDTHSSRTELRRSSEYSHMNSHVTKIDDIFIHPDQGDDFDTDFQ